MKIEINDVILVDMLQGFHKPYIVVEGIGDPPNQIESTSTIEQAEDAFRLGMVSRIYKYDDSHEVKEPKRENELNDN